MKLIAPEGDLRALKVCTVASFAGQKLKSEVLVLGKDNVTPEFSKKSIMGRYPVLEVKEGCICESNAICRHIAKMSKGSVLCGSNAFAAAQVDMWMDFCTYELEIPACCLVQGKATEKAVQDIGSALKALNEHMRTQTYVVGERVTAADICLAVVISHVEQSKKMPSNYLCSVPNVERWLTTMKQKPEFMDAPSMLIQEEIKPEKAEKAKDPLDDLPPTSFDMEEWKRTYVNCGNDFVSAMDYFWKHLDKDGYCFYYTNFDDIYDELTKEHITNNMLGGFLQCCDDTTFRKLNFGRFHILADGNKFAIQGIWLFRGHEIPLFMKAHRSYDSYIFRKLELTEENKKLIDDYWISQTTIGGKPIISSKSFH